ncbi:glycosyltransferase family 2 protein [Marinifilum sp.]|uniref:glycosyltransferase family 2 protein n=1 Tax=Marinifilum sp. TaxID=2033137 RepID=UPI003BA9870B
MLSFIVIGKNEGAKLSKCFKSIDNCIAKNNLKNVEVIYVDSNSNDDSIAIAKSFNVQVYKIKGETNAAHGRVIGAKNANGDAFLFLDGDMEINAEVFSEFYTEKKGLFYPFVTGSFIDVFHDYNWNKIGIGKKNVVTEDKYINLGGGLFFVASSLWNSVGGMDPRFRINEDYEFTIRVRKKGVKLLKKKEILVNHNTINYLDDSRRWAMLKNGYFMYFSYLCKKYLFGNGLLNVFIRNNYTLLVLISSLIIAVCFNLYWVFSFYLIILVLRSIIKKKNLILFYFLRDLQVLYGLFFFRPNLKEITIKEI